jgi:small subunit ribosomal protein S21
MEEAKWMMKSALPCFSSLIDKSDLNYKRKLIKYLENRKISCTFAPTSLKRRLFHNNFNIKNLKNKGMIIVPVKDGENIERALKKFKRKFEKTGVIKELRSRQQFNKPSVLKRLKMEKAIYVQKLRNAEE